MHRLVPFLAAASLLAACADADPTASPPRADAASARLQLELRAIDPGPRAHEQKLAAVARAVPGFGGLFYDAQGTLNVFLTDQGRAPAARAALALAFPSFLPRGDATPLAVRAGRFGFDELQGWYGRFHAVRGLPGVAFTDLNEGTNRLTVAITEPAARPAVQARLTELGVPAEAVEFQVVGGIVQLATLRDAVRPVRGGLLVQRRITSTTAANCTLGFNARLANGWEGFFTNSHCTSTHYGLDSSEFYQNSISFSTRRVGQEALDPPLQCWNETLCRYRYSDASFIRYASGVDWRMGMIAKTTTGLTINSDVAQQWSIHGTDPEYAPGYAVQKTGQLTGTTTGTIGNTCVDVYVAADDANLICQDYATLTAGQGDSGSPVYRLVPQVGTNKVVITGLLWGGTGCDASGNNCTGIVYSRASGVFNDFNVDIGWPTIA